MTSTTMEQRKEETINRKDSFLGLFATAIVIVFLIWISYLFLAHSLVSDALKTYLPKGLFDSKGNIELGTLGDYFGALNTLFAGLAFAGLIVTIRQQSKDLQATKDEMQKQTSQFKEQNQQNKIAQIKEDIYNRISLIKQIERDIKIFSWENGNRTVIVGTHAIETLGNNILHITSELFPDEEDLREAINITSITNDCLSYACSFLYLDAWLNSICLLLDDVDQSFNIVEDERERDILKYRYWRMVLKSSNMSLIPILYANHDTYLQYPIVEHLRKINIIEGKTLSGGITEAKKRELLYSILCNFPGDNADVVVFDILNKWREYKGWPLATMMKAQSVSSPRSYVCSIDELREDPLIQQQMYESQADRLINVTGGSANSQAAACVAFRGHRGHVIKLT